MRAPNLVGSKSNLLGSVDGRVGPAPRFRALAGQIDSRLGTVLPWHTCGIGRRKKLRGLRIVNKHFAFLLAALPLSCLLFMVAGANEHTQKINLPTSKAVTVPVPGFIARTNSFPATIALSPDGRYAALLNQGYGTEQDGLRQSIAILDLSNNQLRISLMSAYAATKNRLCKATS